jgi:putative ABC transport system permease protein
MLTVVQPAGFPLLDAIRVDFPVVLYAVGAAGLTTLAVGLVPALRQSEEMTTLRVGAGSGKTAPWQRLRRMLVVAQVGVAVVLLVGASLLGRSLIRLMTIDIGISAKHVTAVQLEMFRGRPSSFPERKALMDRLVDRVRSIPGVVSAGAGVALPPNRGLLRFTFNRFDEAIGQPKNYLVDAVTATPDYFSTLGIRLRQGRFFTSTDDADRPHVMIITAVTARQIFGDADPIGRTVTLPILTSNPNVPADHGPVTVIGVVDDVKYSGLDVPADGVIYRPFAQQPFPLMFIVVRTQTDVAGLENAIRREISNVDRLVVVHAVNTVTGLISDAAAQPRLRATTFIGLAGLTVALAAVGLYGVVAYMVTQRTSEIGIRMALGADAGSIMGMVLREGMLLALAGVSAGLLSARALAGILRSLLYGVQPTDTLSFVGAAAVLLLVTFLASYIPARRATRVDPLVALRCE